MKGISGNKLLVKALHEEGVDTLFGYPGACTIDISDELFEDDENYAEHTGELYEGEEEYEMDLDYLLGKSLYEEEDGTVFILENNEKIFLSTEDVAMIDEYARQK